MSADQVMRRIQKLPQELVHRIAAGEVVDRPASALKELCENSLDAGATILRITIVGGGIDLIEVDDDGLGMDRDNLERSLERHATSKISTLEDLDHIYSLGFRGEALAALSSVSFLEIESLAQGAAESWALSCDGSMQRSIKPGLRLGQGTRVSVKDLFFNTPARRKFLRKPSAEARSCVEVLRELAMAHPNVAWHWTVVDQKGEVVDSCQLPVAPQVERCQALWEQQGRVFEVNNVDHFQLKRMSLIGLYPPASTRHSRSVSLVVNGRVVIDKRLPFAVREAWSGLIEVGVYPVLHVNLEVDPSLIDVNIHPQKRELRWPTGFSLGGIVFKALQSVLRGAPRESDSRDSSSPLQGSESTEVSFFGATEMGDSQGFHAGTASTPRGATTWERSQAPRPLISDFDLVGSLAPRISDLSQTLKSPESVASTAKARTGFVQSQASPGQPFASMRVVGEVGAAWILLESRAGLVLVDQHAAHERVRFEELCRKPLIRSKPLLIPIELKLPLGIDVEDQSLHETLHSFGFESDYTQTAQSGRLVINAVPEADRKLDWSEMLNELFEREHAGVSRESYLARIRVQLAASLACHSSVRRGQRLGIDEIKSLLVSMDQLNWGGLCPHGRPLWFVLSHSMIEEFFHRS